MKKKFVHYVCEIEKRQTKRRVLRAVCKRNRYPFTNKLSDVTCPHCMFLVERDIHTLVWLIFKARFYYQDKHARLPEIASPSSSMPWELRTDEFVLIPGRDVWCGELPFASRKHEIRFWWNDSMYVLGTGVILREWAALLYMAYRAQNHFAFTLALAVQEREHRASLRELERKGNQ